MSQSLVGDESGEVAKDQKIQSYVEEGKELK